MLLPIPTHAPRPRHKLMSRTTRSDAVELQVLKLTASRALSAQRLNEFGPDLCGPDRTQTAHYNWTRHYFRPRDADIQTPCTTFE